MIVRKIATATAVLGAIALNAWADTVQHEAGNSPYAGFQDRDIKSLSDSDIEDIRQGRGWGLALPAELNGLPGPTHILELQHELQLSPEQVAQVQAIFDEMREEAIAAGDTFIEAERALSLAFQDAQLDQEQLATLVTNAAEARAKLRNIHLSRHLMTPAILTSDQIQRYAVLRGYQDNPCAAVPEGHNAEMWRKHNNCS